MSSALDNVECHFVETWDEAQSLLSWLGEQRQFLGIDLETTGVDVGRDKIRLAQFGDANHCWAVNYTDWKGLVRTIIERYDRPIVAHNLLFESRFLKRDGLPLKQHLSFDSMVMAHIFDPRYAIGLEARAARHIDKRAFNGKKALTEAFHAGKWDWSDIPIDHPSYWIYGALDATLGALIAEELWPKIQDCHKIYEVEMACIHVLRDAGLTGVAVDLEYCGEQIIEAEYDLEKLREKIPFSPSKDKQAIEWLETQGVSETHPWQMWPKTEKGGRALDDEVLQAVEPHLTTDTVCALREWRKKDKILRSYFRNFIEMHDDGVLYPSVKPLGARTGRMSVTEPALQTLPRGSVVRNAFVAREGHTLVLADYQQMELRVMASKAEEHAMIETFERGEDQHRWVASNTYEVPVENVTSAQRAIAKNAQFAMIYGAGNDKVAITSKASIEVITEFMDRYHETFPGIRRYMQQTLSTVNNREFHGEKNTGYVETVLGRRLPVEKNKAYKGVNYEIQGSSADILKLKLIELSAAGVGDFIRLPVHDEIIFEVPDDCLQEACATIHEVMPEYDLFDAPLAIDVTTTKRWGSAYESFD